MTIIMWLNLQMKAFLVICIFLLSCTHKRPPLNEGLIINALEGKRWRLTRVEDLSVPESEDVNPPKCAIDDELEFKEEGYFLYRVNEKCSEYEYDHAVRWRISELDKKFYIDYYLTKFIAKEFQSRHLIEEMDKDEIVLKVLKNDQDKKEDKNGNWYVLSTPIPENYDFTWYLKKSN